MLGTGSIKIKFILDEIEYEKTLVNKNYLFENNYNKKLLSIRRDIRTGQRKQVFKGNEKEFIFTLFNITVSEWENFYSKLANLKSVDVFPHLDKPSFFPCYLDNIEFSLYDVEIGKIDFKFKTNIFKVFNFDAWILEKGIWKNNAIWKNDGLWKFTNV